MAIGRAFRIKRSDVAGYSHRDFRSNPGVTAIAAVNGRGAFARRFGNQKVPEGLRERLVSAYQQDEEPMRSYKYRFHANPARKTAKKTVKKTAKKSTSRKTRISDAVEERGSRSRKKASRKEASRKKAAKKTTTGKKASRKKATRKKKTARRAAQESAAPARKQRKQRKRRKKAAAETPRKKRQKRSSFSKAARMAELEKLGGRIYADVERINHKTGKPFKRSRLSGTVKDGVLYLRNAPGDLMGTLTAGFKTGALVTGALLATKAATRAVETYVMGNLVGSPAEGKPAATGSLAALQPYSGAISGVLAALGVSVAANFLIEDATTRNVVIGGAVASALHSVVVGLLTEHVPSTAPWLAGIGESEALRLSAMYGFDRNITSNYQILSGLGEYYNPAAGIGEYYNPAAGIGEYYNPAAGVGNYEPNPDYQASVADGMSVYVPKHLSPGTDLDSALTIAEAAAGVGELYQAAAGVGELYQAAAGVGALYQAAAGVGEYINPQLAGVVPDTDTWIPGGAADPYSAAIRPVSDTPSDASQPAGIFAQSRSNGMFT